MSKIAELLATLPENEQMKLLEQVSYIRRRWIVRMLRRVLWRM